MKKVSYMIKHRFEIPSSLSVKPVLLQKLVTQIFQRNVLKIGRLLIFDTRFKEFFPIAVYLPNWDGMESVETSCSKCNIQMSQAKVCDQKITVADW